MEKKQKPEFREYITKLDGETLEPPLEVTSPEPPAEPKVYVPPCQPRNVQACTEPSNLAKRKRFKLCSTPWLCCHTCGAQNGCSFVCPTFSSIKKLVEE